MLSKHKKGGFLYDYTPFYANETAYKTIKSTIFEAVRKRGEKFLQNEYRGPLVVESISYGNKGDFFCLFIIALEPILETIPGVKIQPDLN